MKSQESMCLERQSNAFTAKHPVWRDSGYSDQTVHCEARKLHSYPSQSGKAGHVAETQFRTGTKGSILDASLLKCLLDISGDETGALRPLRQSQSPSVPPSRGHYRLCEEGHKDQAEPFLLIQNQPHLAPAPSIRGTDQGTGPPDTQHLRKHI